MSSNAPDFSQGLALHQAGKLEEARACYEAILEKEPNNEHILHVLAMVDLSQKKTDQGIERLRRCLVIRPAFPEAMTNLGSALLEKNKAQEALALHDQAIGLNPNLAEIHANRGNALRALRRPDEAIEAFRRAIKLKPTIAEAHNNLANMLKGLRRYDEAVVAYREALRLRPNYFEAWYNLGNSLFAQGFPDRAEGAYRKALALAPRHPESHNNLGTALKGQGKLQEALDEFAMALALRPGYAEAHAGKGDVFQFQNRLEEAVAAYQQALASNPAQMEAWCNLGNALNAQNKPGEAAQAYGRALELKPGMPEVKYNEALAHLVSGDLERGWENYECRWEQKKARRRPFAQPLWNGEGGLEGKTILLYSEQGLGDTLQFVRYAPLVEAKGARVVLEVQPPLKSLLARASGVSGAVARKEPLPAFDLHCPLMSLPKAFGTRLDTIPVPIPYVWPTEEKVSHWKSEFDGKAGLKVGMVWSGNPGHQNDHNRSLRFSEFWRIFSGSGGAFFSLQKEARASDAADLAASGVTDLGPRLHDFEDTAAILAQLDLVVSVDTSVVHLAGAMGIPTWLLLPFSPDWRWLLDRNDSPWYPSIRIFRQQAPGVWGGALDQVSSAWERLSQLPRPS